ncbi:MAG: ComF family protein [Candidatus Omnitrophica bacterium]|nr:ComF family protein [Candidatus Omnitrophota bacterium]MCF7891603.1 ComF family protein [Candidatus Omnitrophota bacterium]MCF7895897.1 ComF family protein [Candidatus Omnitrophota bacterium]MCF7897555.1 ComF family protein [Candidatus Omnitrophota bacterium]MCF7909230.1 ComF family protein [Candidatus Omnitrophota bacterium]
MLRRWAVTAKNLFFPLTCLNCKAKISGEYLCRNCQNQIKFLTPPGCYSQIEINQNNLKVASSYSYQNPIKTLIHLFKYSNYDYLAPALAKLMIEQLDRIGFKPLNYDFITPVPIHPYKIKIRGYNQSKLLAKQLANYFQLPLKDDIISSKYIKNSQTKLSLEKRKENVSGKFTAKNSAKNTNILLVDDVFTTGATILACGKALWEKGANKIYGITLAK